IRYRPTPRQSNVRQYQSRFSRSPAPHWSRSKASRRGARSFLEGITAHAVVGTWTRILKIVNRIRVSKRVSPRGHLLRRREILDINETRMDFAACGVGDAGTRRMQQWLLRQRLLRQRLLLECSAPSCALRGSGLCAGPRLRVDRWLLGVSR